MLDVTDSVVLADALHCNQNSANTVIDAGADYLFVIKDNVPTLKSDIELFIQKEKVPSFTTKEKMMVESKHERLMLLLILLDLRILAIGTA